METRRNRVRVYNPDFAYDEEIDVALKNMGIDQETLEADLRNSLTLEPGVINIDRYVFVIDGREYLITAEKTGETGVTWIVDWLNRMSLEMFLHYWNTPGLHDAIASLMRYPGGLHEWLMIACLPIFKVMGIPMELVKKYRTPIEECTFSFNGDVGTHGGTGSTTMHNDLRAAIIRAYERCREEKALPLDILKEELRGFAGIYYGSIEEIPKALARLIS